MATNLCPFVCLILKQKVGHLDTLTESQSLLESKSKVTIEVIISSLSIRTKQHSELL